MEGIEKLKDRSTHCIDLKGEYIKKENRFLHKNKFLFILSRQYQTPQCIGKGYAGIDLHLKRNEYDPFLKRIITDDEKWII